MRVTAPFSGALLALTLLGVLPLAAQEQLPPPGAPPALPDSVVAMIEEFRSLEATLNQLQAQAMAASPELQAREDALQAQVEEAMFEVDPELEAQMGRMKPLEADMQRAQQARNQQAIQSLLAEARQIEAAFRVAQDQVLGREGVARSIEVFEADVMDAMMAIDVTSQEMLDRLMALGTRIEAATQLPGGG